MNAREIARERLRGGRRPQWTANDKDDAFGGDPTLSIEDHGKMWVFVLDRHSVRSDEEGQIIRFWMSASDNFEMDHDRLTVKVGEWNLSFVYSVCRQLTLMPAGHVDLEPVPLELLAMLFIAMGW